MILSSILIILTLTIIYMDPQLISLPVINAKGGSLSFIESAEIPFKVERLYWIYGIGKDEERGGHSHKNSDRLLICMHGHVDIQLENKDGKIHAFELDHPDKALFFPRNHWIKINLSKDAVLLTLASCILSEDIYEKDYQAFKKNG